MRILLSLVALTLLSLGVIADDKDKKFDVSKMVGDWNITSGKRAGEDIDKERLKSVITWTKDSVTIPVEGGQKFVMTFKVDSSKSPAKIEMKIKEGPVPDGAANGVISLDGEELKLCYSVEGMGGKTPEKMESTKDNQAFMFVMKKKK